MPLSAFLDLDWAAIRTYERELYDPGGDELDWDAAATAGATAAAWDAATGR